MMKVSSGTATVLLLLLLLLLEKTFGKWLASGVAYVVPSSTTQATSRKLSVNESNEQIGRYQNMSSEDNDDLVIAVVQPPLRPDNCSPLESAQIVSEMMHKEKVASKEKHIHLYVLPELCPLGYTEHTFAEYLPKNEDVYAILKEVDDHMSQTAIDLQAYVCYGTIGVVTPTQDEEGNEKHRNYTIRQVVLNPQGDVVCNYDKIHLCDYGDCAETRFFTPGDPNNLGTFTCHSIEIGIIICADIRNPTLSRKLTSRGKVDVLLQPSAFSRDISFRTWKSFRETRAVENSVYFVGVNYGGEYFGDSCIVEPWVDEHHEPISLGVKCGVMTGRIKRAALNWARTQMPYYRQMLSEKW